MQNALKKGIFFGFIIAILYFLPINSFALVRCTDACVGAVSSCQIGDVKIIKAAQDNTGNTISIESSIVNGPVLRTFCIVGNQQSVLNPDTQQQEMAGDICETIQYDSNGKNKKTFSITSSKGYDFSIFSNPANPSQCVPNVQVTVSNLPTVTLTPTKTNSCLNTVGALCGKLNPTPACPGYYCDAGVAGNAPNPRIAVGTPTPTPNINFGDESYDSLAGRAENICGHNAQQCCLPLGKLPPLSLKSIVSGGWFSSLASWMVDKFISGTTELATASVDQMNQMSADTQICPAIKGKAVIVRSPDMRTEEIPGSTVISQIKNVDSIKSCLCTDLSAGLSQVRQLCYNIPPNTTEYIECDKCSTTGIWTAIGCVPFSVESFIQNFIFKFGISLAGISSLLCIAYASFIMQTSSGQPEKIKHAQDLMTSCITGLLLVIFSVFILKVIGVDILQLPGFVMQ